VIIPISNFCDGTNVLGNNANKPADCPDGSDEILDICCEGNYEAYNTTVCE
jgi:hypothetical protein